MQVLSVNCTLRFRHDQISGIVFIELCLVLAYIDRLILIVCNFFSYFGMSINYRSWVCKLHNMFLICAETETISMFEGFCTSFLKVQFQHFFLVSNLSKSNLYIINVILDLSTYVDNAYITGYLVICLT